MQVRKWQEQACRVFCQTLSLEPVVAVTKTQLPVDYHWQPPCMHSANLGRHSSAATLKYC